jgi:hypothetical protein
LRISLRVTCFLIPLLDNVGYDINKVHFIYITMVFASFLQSLMAEADMIRLTGVGCTPESNFTGVSRSITGYLKDGCICSASNICIYLICHIKLLTQGFNIYSSSSIVQNAGTLNVDNGNTLRHLL